MKKKAFALLIALALCIGMAVPAMAAVGDITIETDFASYTYHGIEKQTTFVLYSMQYGNVERTLNWMSPDASVTFRATGAYDIQSYNVSLLAYGPFTRNTGEECFFVDDAYSFRLTSTDEYTVPLSELTGPHPSLDGWDDPRNYDGTHFWGIVTEETEFYFTFTEPTNAQSATPPAPETPSTWAVDYVNTAIDAGLVPDALQSKYTTATTRAEFCALAVALYENVKGSEITERSTFSDTTDVNVEKMAALNVVNGVGDGKFSPNSPLTREQAATMLSRLADAIGKPLTAQAPTFKDKATVSSWAVDAVGQMQATGIMTGVGDNTFAPKSDYTREQSIITILRLFDAVK